MKRLVGGDYLLDLTPIDIEESVDVETYTNITNTEVITQLTNLKKYISNPSMIKPVWIELKNGETDELVVARGELKVVNTGEFEIVVQLDGYKLKIHVEFTQVLNADNDPLDDWFIDTNDAKYLFTSDTQNIGAISELPVFENIVDKDGHNRFIEDDIVLLDTAPTGISLKYGKWSLNGTNLIIVFAFDTEDTTSVSNGTALALCKNVPQWVIDKIVPLFSIAVVSQTIDARGDDWSSQAFNYFIQKASDGLRICSGGNYTSSGLKHIRVVVNLLIDNE